MSKENTTNGILEETPEKSQTLENTTENATKSVEEKSLEELENEKLQAISQGDLPETAINYSNYINKPNKIIETPNDSIEKDNLLNSSSVRKINSRPDSKELRKRRKKRRNPNENGQEHHHSNSNRPIQNDRPIKIDSKNKNIKSQVESGINIDNNVDIDELNEKLDLSEKFRLAKEKRNNIDDFPKENQGASTGPIDISEKFNLAKAKRTKKINELNSNLNKNKINSKPVKENSKSSIEPPKVEITQTINKKNLQNSIKKKSLIERIENYFFVVEDTVENTKENKSKFKFFQKKEKSVDKTSKVVDNSSNLNLKDKFNSIISKAKMPKGVNSKVEEIKETPVEVEEIKETPVEVEEIKETPIEVEEIKETPVEVEEIKETPIEVEGIKETPVEVEEIKETPVEVEEIKETPVEVEEIKETPVEVEEIKETPIEVEEIKETPIEVEEIKETPVEVEEIKETPVEVEEIKETPVEVEEIKETPVEVEEIKETPIEVEEIKETPVEVEEVKFKEKSTLKSFTKSLFFGDDYIKKDKPKKETFKQRMIDFFYPLEEVEEEFSQDVEEIKVDKPVIKEEIKADEPVINEEIKADEPIINEDIKVNKPLSLYRRVKNFFLSEENSNIETTEPTIEETSKEEILEPIIEETSKEEILEPIIEETSKEEIPEPIFEETSKEEIPEPIFEETSKEEILEPIIEETPKEEILEPIFEKNSKEEISQTEEKYYIEDTVKKITENTQDDDANLILPFNEDTPSEAIDIPIEEPPQYAHFWQDPDFSIIDRVKTYRRNYKNRKRSGDFHMEIKSTPDTAILFEDLERKILAQEQLSKSREEYRKQVANGEYDDFEENPTKKIDEDPVFYKNSIADFNSYEETETIKDYISDMKNSLMIKMVITTLMTILSFYITIANDLELPLPDTLNVTTSASGYLLVQCILGLLTILTSIKMIFSGIVKIFKGKSDCDSLASIGIVFPFISTILAYLFGQNIVEDRILNVYMCVGIIGILCNLWGKNLILRREEHNFKYISKDKSKYGLYCIQDDDDAEDITKGLVDDCPITTYNKKSKFAKDFIKYTYSRDMADKFSQVAVPLIVIVSFLVSLIAGIVYNKTFEMQIPVAITSILSMLISFCSCFSISININSMLSRISEKYIRREGALLGYQAVEDFYDTNSIVISSNDIFPKNSIKLCGMKLFANGKIDETLLYAISLANKCNSILAPTLMKIIENHTDYLYEVENYSYKDDLGICGWIDNKRILMGNRELMEEHNVENLPSKSKELELTGSNRDAVYISISGNLALMLIVEVTPNKDVKRYLQTLEDNNISIAVTSADFLVSISRISYLYDINEENLKIIPYSVYQDNKRYFEDKPECSSSIITGGNMNVLTDLLVITKKIHRNALIGNILYAVACILGILIGISFITMGAFKELNPTMILFYNGVCTLITILLTKLKV